LFLYRLRINEGVQTLRGLSSVQKKNTMLMMRREDIAFSRNDRPHLHSEARTHKGIHNAPAWTIALQIHVGGVDEVEERGKKMVVCRAKLLPAGDPASSPKKHEKSTAKDEREERDWLR
jgi:hypothetical protein